MSSLILNGDTSGSVTFQVPAVAGTNTLTIPAVTGTISVLPADWTFTESSGTLIISSGGVAKAKLDTSGNLTVIGNVTAYGTI